MDVPNNPEGKKSLKSRLSKKSTKKSIKEDFSFKKLQFQENPKESKIYDIEKEIIDTVCNCYLLLYTHFSLVYALFLSIYA